MRSRSTATQLLLLILSLLQRPPLVFSFQTCPTVAAKNIASHGSFLRATNDEEEDPMMLEQGPEQSRMKGFISDFLKSNKDPNKTNRKVDDDDDDIYSYSHLIAIPMDSCNELLLELESVQRAILYHCPVLVHACIVPAVTRLPLLYVKAPPPNIETTPILHKLVHDKVQKHISVLKNSAVLHDEEEAGIDGANEDGYRPWLMGFSTLEVDGDNNNVLTTVGMPDHPGTKLLQDLVHDLQESIHSELGWKTLLPPDPHQSDPIFRPRIPFMRLPSNFDQVLKQNQEQDFFTSDQGGNGISPIFWAQWWDDIFGPNVRLPEIGIYLQHYAGPEQPIKSPEQVFHLPFESIPLPLGNRRLQKQEQHFEEYQESRMKQSADEAEMDESDVPQDDYMLQKTKARLEALYQRSGYEETPIADSPTVESTVNEETPSSNTVEKETLDLDRYDPTRKSLPTDAKLDDWMSQRIRKIVQAREDAKTKAIETKNNLPPVEDNPVFQKFKDGTLVDKKDRPAAVATQPALPPYPSREHFVGFWRVITSPTGFPTIEPGDDDTQCENLILRVDGTTAGGPILDQETNQKAAGGTWRMLVGEEPNDVRLRIRLVIPPKKERILVMQGYAENLQVGAQLPMASSSFGIPELEERSQRGQGDMEDLLHCSGKVWIEDAITGKNRDEIGQFSLMKQNTPRDPSQYTITIPRPVRNQD